MYTHEFMRRVSAKSLENAALHYLKRYSASVLQLRRVLTRKAQRTNRERGGEPVDAAPLIAALLERLVNAGYLDDARLAVQKTSSLRRNGKSSRVIRQTLRLKGLGEHVEARPDAQADADAIWVYARKKRLGPYAKIAGPKDFKVRTRELAAFARAGFSFALAKQVVEARKIP